MVIRLRSLADLPRGPAPTVAAKPKRKVGKAKSPPPPLEKAIQKECLSWLASVGIFAFRINSGAVSATHNGKRRYMKFNSARGCSDVLAVLPDGRFAAIEIKRPGNLPTDDQRDFLASVQRAGGVALFCTSVPDLQEKLRLEGYDL